MEDTTSPNLSTKANFETPADFVTLVSIQNDELIINTAGMRQLFNKSKTASIPFSIHFSLNPINLDFNSHLSGLLLIFANAKSISPISGISSDIFLDAKANCESLSIVAYKTPVITKDKDDGNMVAHVFLDIWGKADLNDAKYKVLAGLAAAMSSTMICIAEKKMKSSTWEWLENCLEFGRKWSSQIQQFQRLVILINKWEKLDEYRPGVIEGSRYMRETFGVSPDVKSVLQSSSSASPEAMRVIQQMSDWDCFLFPVKTIDTFDAYDQNLESFQALVLGVKQQGKVIQGVVACGEDICAFLHNLPKIGDVLSPEIVKKLEQQISTKQEIVEKLNEEISTPPELVENDGAVGGTNYVDQTSNIQVYTDYANQGISEFSNNFSDSEEDGDDRNVDSTPATLPTKEIIEDAEKFWNDNAKDLFSDFHLPSKNNDDFEFDFIPETTLSSSKPETEKGPSNIQEFTSSVPVDSPRPEITPPLPDTPSAEDIINRIFQQTPKPVRPVGYISGLKLINDKVSQDVNKLTFSETFAEETDTSPSLIEAPIKPEEDKSDSSQLHDSLLTIACKTFDELHINSNNYEFSVIWAHVEKTAGEHTSIANNISNALLTSLQIVDNYLTQMDGIMQSSVCFPREYELLEISKSIKEQDRLPSSSDANDALTKMGPFLLKKLQNAENTFLRLNQDIFSAEKRTAEFCIGHIFKFYTTQIESNSRQKGESLPEFQNRHKNLVNYCTQAFNHSYGETNRELNSIFLKNLESKLNSDYTSRENKYRLNQMPRQLPGTSLVQDFQARYNSDIDSQFGNPAINTTNLDMTHKTVSDDSKKEAEKLSPDGESTFSTKLENEVSTSKHELQEKHEEYKPVPMRRRLLPNNETPSNGTIPPLETPVLPTHVGKAVEHISLAQQASKSSDLIPVGVYFGLDLLSVVAFINGKFRQVYGPEANVISLGKEIFIGNYYKSDTSKIKLRSFRGMFEQVDIGKKTYRVRKFDDTNIRFRLEGVVALILSQVYQHTAAELLSDKLKFMITIPSSSNSTMWNVFIDAITISQINADIVRESCCLLTKNIHEKIIPDAASRVLVFAEDDKNKTCDVICYMKCNEPWLIEFVAGYLPLTNLFNINSSSGFQVAIQNIPKHLQHLFSEVIHYSTGYTVGRDQNTLQRIKDAFPKLTSNSAIFAKCDDIVNGACLLAAYSCVPSWKAKRRLLANILSPESSHPSGITGHKSLIPHTGDRFPQTNLGTHTIKIQEIISDLFKELATAKDDVQRRYLMLAERISGKSKEQLDQVMRDIQKEHLSARKVHSMFDARLTKLRDATE